MSEKLKDSITDDPCDLAKCGHIGIKEICDTEINFFVPEYQRGYRWNEAQIDRLIDDINNYEQANDGDYYCLQPLVVLYDSTKSCFRVIDGQQRLTTTWLLLKLLGVRAVFNLIYARDNCLPSDFGNLNIDESTEERYRITTACATISTKLKAIDKDKLQEILLDKVKFIWYPVKGDSEYEHKLFLNLNSGKIPLNDAELIKALLFHDVGRGENNERTLRQTGMAQQWDMMEKTLRQPSFWHFIAGREEVNPCAMDYLLDIHYRAHTTDDERTNYEKNTAPVFTWVEDRSNKADVWEEIMTTFDRLQGWYKDLECYNLIGYHTSFIAAEARKDKLAEYLSQMNDKSTTTTMFKATLWDSAIREDNLVSEEDEVKIMTDQHNELALLEYRYKADNYKISKILLLLNISFYSIGGVKRRFEFDKFNDPENPWNIEHISPQNPKDNSQLLKWLDEIKCELPKDIKDIKGLLERIEQTEEKDFTELKALTSEERDNFNRIKEKYLPTEENYIMTLPNLTLLTEHTNKSIGNKFFFDKRKALCQKQEDGCYIPQLTWNVFTKWYSPNATTPLFWEESDRVAYKDGIVKLLKRILEYINTHYGNESKRITK